ncbi:MAG: o-succinylbenzoate synthase [bacterium]
MIELTSLTLREIALPLREPFRISSGVTTGRRILLLELTSADGTTAWSECVAGERPNYSPETIETAWTVIREYAAPRLLGVEVASAPDVHPLLEEDFRGHNMAKAALEMGMWELAARQKRVPLSRLLGGERERIEVGISIGIQEDPQALAVKAADRLAEGYRKIKLKVEPGADVPCVAAVRDALGPDAPLMVDANNAYTLDDLPLLKELDAFGLIMIEQPLAWDDVVQHAKLQRELDTPICLDESITSPQKARDMIELEAGRIVNIKPGRVGGLTPSVNIHDICRRAGVPVWCGGMLESGVGRGYNVALASLPGFTIPGDVSPSRRYWERDIVEPEWTMEEGTIAVPSGRSGIGVEVDIGRVEDLTVRAETLSVG